MADELIIADAAATGSTDRDAIIATYAEILASSVPHFQALMTLLDIVTRLRNAQIDSDRAHAELKELNSCIAPKPGTEIDYLYKGK